MDDDEGEVIRRSDLSHEVPTSRANVEPHLEKAKLKIGKDGVDMGTESYTGSPQNKAVTTFFLATAICTVTLTVWWIGLAAGLALVVGAGIVIGLYLLTHFTPRPRR